MLDAKYLIESFASRNVPSPASRLGLCCYRLTATPLRHLALHNLTRYLTEAREAAGVLRDPTPPQDRVFCGDGCAGGWAGWTRGRHRRLRGRLGQAGAGAAQWGWPGMRPQSSRLWRGSAKTATALRCLGRVQLSFPRRPGRRHQLCNNTTESRPAILTFCPSSFGKQGDILKTIIQY